MRSMTGYGKAEYNQNGIKLSVEIKTVNNRFLDVSPKYPRSFIGLDDVIRKTVQENVKRGKADLFISYSREDLSEYDVELNLPLLKAYYNVSRQILKEVDEVVDDYNLTSILKTPDVVKQTQSELDLELLSGILKETIKNACDSLNVMRDFEGEKLEKDLLSRVENIESIVSSISKRAPMLQEEYRLKLLEKVSQLLENTQIDQSRIVQETAVFADKTNIDEELTRLKSHVSQFRSICKKGEDVGKKLDFLIQEFNREANTVCSKSNDIEITNYALNLKCEIEKMREQIQNIE